MRHKVAGRKFDRPTAHRKSMYRNLVTTFDSTAPDSVHLAQWPQANPTLIDQRLMDEMELFSEVGKGTTVTVRKWLRVVAASD